MKKMLALILLASLALTACLSGCGGTEAEGDDGKLKIVATVFPPYDFARQICGENADVSMLLPPGVESHSYEPSPKDIIAIQSCDLFIYGGGESDTWVDEVLSSMDKPVKTLRMMECVALAEEELKEGMEAGHDHDDHDEHDEHDDHDDEHGEDVEYDEHVWTSPANAALIVRAIADAVKESDPKNAVDYESAAASYAADIEALDAEFEKFFEGVEDKTFIVGDRFPLLYFAREYGLDYYAAFPGCSSETEASAATIAFLIDKVHDNNISTVFYIEFSNHIVADAIAREAGVKTEMFHVCHNVTQAELDDGVTYVSLMERNLAVLKEAMR